MIILKVISRLLDYPSEALFNASAELIDIVNNQALAHKNELTEFITELCQQDIYDAQERYDLLFDRGRALSLLLFEHVHGESRDRGQAMVDLMKVYQSRGFELSSEQLPDYLPIYLEFLSEQEPLFVLEWLGDISHLLALLAERLRDRESPYAVLFETLIEISQVKIDRQQVAETVAQETRDDTVEAIDQAWLDKEIRFDDPMQAPCSTSGLAQHNGQLSNQDPTQVPIKWHDAAPSSESRV